MGLAEAVRVTKSFLNEKRDTQVLARDDLLA
jgi:hypothetical protein